MLEKVFKYYKYFIPVYGIIKVSETINEYSVWSVIVRITKILALMWYNVALFMFFLDTVVKQSEYAATYFAMPRPFLFVFVTMLLSGMVLMYFITQGIKKTSKEEIT